MPGDRTVKVVLKGDISDFNRAMLAASAGAKTFTNSLDTSTDRMANMVQTSLALGPALIPVAAAGIPAIAGLSNELGLAAVGAGVTALAFSGVGDALKATNDYAVEPTEANLAKMRQTLAELGPAGQEFVGFLQRLRPRLQELQDVAQAGLLPGAEAGITELLDLLPQAERIVSTVATSIGDLISEAGSNLNDPRWHEFFDFLEHEARPTLINMGRTLGNFVEGFANLWVAFAPLSDQFSHSFLDMSRSFSAWTAGLDETEGFQEFIDYISENGPRVWDALTAIGNALLQIVEAAAPVGSAALPVIEAVSDAVAAIADSDLGPVIIGVVSLTSAFTRLYALGKTANTSIFGDLLSKSAYGSTLSSVKALPGALIAVESAAERAQTKAGQLSATSQRLGASLRGTARLAGGAGGLAFAMSDLDDKMGLTYTTMGALVGSAFPGFGTAIGAGIGAVIDLTHQTDDAAESIKRFDAAFDNAKSAEEQGAVIAQLRDGIAEAVKAADAGIPGLSDHIREWQEQLFALEAQHKVDKRAADDATFAEAGLGDAMAFSSEQVRGETLALLDNIRAKNNAADAAENAFSAETNYRQALKDAAKQARTNNAGIKGSSDAALKNRESLDQLASAWNRQADAGGKSRVEMRKAQAAFIQVAEDMGVSSERAQQLAKDLFHLPSKVDTRVNLLGVDGALDKIQHIKDRLLSLDGTTAQTFVQIKESVGKADGGLVRRFDSGGHVRGPGGPREDLIPAMLSNNEYVIPAQRVDQYGVGMFDAIRAGRFADGGPARLQSFSPAGSAPSSTTTQVVDVDVSGVRVGHDRKTLEPVLQGMISVAISQNNAYQRKP